MNINPRLTEQVAEVSAKAKNAIIEELSKGEIREEVTSELPRMSLESVMPKGNIITTAKKALEDFDVKKAIEEFNDIHDTATIEKICNAWRKELLEMEDKFLSGEIEPAKIYEEHRKFLEGLDKYSAFTTKISDMISGGSNIEESMKIFEQYLEPTIMRSQSAMHTIDNLPSVRGAYQLAKGEAPAAKVSVSVNHDFIEHIQSMTNLDEASSLLTKLEKEKAKGSISSNEFDDLSEMIGQQLEDIVSGKIKPAAPKAEQSIKKVFKDLVIDPQALSQQIDQLLAVDLASGKIGDISNKIYELARTDKAAYDELIDKFNTKIIELSS